MLHFTVPWMQQHCDFHMLSVLLFFLPLGISTSLLFNLFIAVFLKLSHCILLFFTFHCLSTPCLGHCLCGTALLEWCRVNSEILPWDKGPSLPGLREKAHSSHFCIAFTGVTVTGLRLNAFDISQESEVSDTAPYQRR